MGKMKLTKDELFDLNLRYQAAYQMNQRHIPTLTKAVRLCAPLSDGLNILYGYSDTGKEDDKFIFDSTAQWCSNSKANQLHSLLFPIEKQWGTIHTTDENGKDIYQEEITNKVFDAIDKSNLHSVLKAFFLDLNIGCAALWVNSPSKERPLVFKNIAGITLMPELSDDPENTDVWFKRAINWRDLNRINAKVARDKDITEEYYITAGYIDLRATHGGYCYLQFLDEDFTEPLAVDWSEWRQLILVNETLRPGEARGHGTILQILSEISYLNDIAGNLKGYIKYSSRPDLIIPDQLPGDWGVEGGNIYPTEMAEDGRGGIVQPVQWQLDMQSIINQKLELQQKIRQFFNVMPLGMPEHTPHATATEVGYRQADAQRQSVADLSRIANESNGGVLRAAFDVAKHRGLIKTNIKDFSFKFDSPAVDIQAQTNLNAVLQLSEMTTQILGQGSPAIYMNPQETYDYLAKNLRTPASVSNSPEQSKKVASDMQKAAQGQQQPQQPQQQGQSLTPSPLAPADSINPSQLSGANTIGL
jgi:hypothetical protein